MSYFSEDRAAELRQLFFESAQELLQTLNDEALRLEKHPSEAEIVHGIRRAVHTLKGDSAACGFRELSDIAHELEDALAPEVLEPRRSAELVELVLQAADIFDAMLAAYRGGLPLPVPTALREMIRRLSSAARGEGKRAAAPHLAACWTEYQERAIQAAVQAGGKVYHVALELEPHCPMKAAAWQLVCNALQRLGEVLALQPENAAVDDLARVEAVLCSDKPEEWITARCRIPAVTGEVSVHPWRVRQPVQEDKDESRGQSSTPASGDSILRVDAQRLDELLNLIGELIIGRSMLQQVLAEFSRRFAKDALRARFADAMAYQVRVLNDLQRSAMQVRMVPVEQLFRRFPRLVRDLAKQCGKDVALLLSGQHTELDKSILDDIAEPLVHLVRNAVDHGLESAEDRRTAGKLAKGTVRLNAYHQGNQVVVEVGDDGRGIDPETVLRTALEKGLVTAEQAARLTPPQILELIFEPGFTTAGQVTEISGRGIGMDVVHTVLRRLKGTVSIDSKPGQGTTFLLKVPLTLAIIKALLLRVGQHLYALPLNSVVEICRARAGDIHRVDCHEMLQVRGTVLPLLRMHRVAEPEPADRKMFIAVVAVGESKYGLVADSLVGEEELVIKPLNEQLAPGDLVSGGSILGDGTVVLILNLPAVVERCSRGPLPPPAVLPAHPPSAALQGGTR